MSCSRSESLAGREGVTETTISTSRGEGGEEDEEAEEEEDEEEEEGGEGGCREAGFSTSSLLRSRSSLLKEGAAGVAERVAPAAGEAGVTAAAATGDGRSHVAAM